MQTDAQKLQAIETSLRRWHTRLTIASNKVAKFEKQRRRLQLQMLTPNQPAIAVVKVKAGKVTAVEPPKPLIVAYDDPDLIEKATAALDAITKQDDPFAIPPELNRADPLIAEKMTAARKKAEEAARHAMPLADKAAAAYIKRKK
jgi:hypothetical protein